LARRRGVNLIGGAPFYEVYETADRRYISITSIEPQFYGELLRRIGLDQDPIFKEQMCRDAWPEMSAKLGAIFSTKTRDEWCTLLEGTDVCFAPVLSMTEAPAHPHAIARKSFVDLDGVVQPAPAPRYSVSELKHPRNPQTVGLEQLNRTWDITL
jgi:alpha-methylacyl-CoA racemase